MKTIKAFYNHGRWLVQCPIHGAGGAMPAGEEYICPVCYRGSIANIVKIVSGRLITIPDRSARKTARITAEKDGKLYLIKYPAKREEIEKELNKIPANKRNWQGEPMEQVKEHVQKTKHLIRNYEKRDKKLDGNNNIVVIER